MPEIKTPGIILTEDGSHTLYHPDTGDHYHSMYGAVTESLHIYIREGFSFHPSAQVSILEMGFGTGLNVLLTLKQAMEENREVTYHSVDKYILPAVISDSLNYREFCGDLNPDYFNLIHRLSWDEPHELKGSFHLLKIQADIRTLTFPHKYDIVYFDAFGPDKQPEMWTEDIFRKIYHVMNPGGILTTYSVKGEIRRRFLNCGWMVEKIPGPRGKREILRCTRKD